MVTNSPPLPSIIPSGALKSSSTSATYGDLPSSYTGTMASNHSALESSNSSSRESSSHSALKSLSSSSRESSPSDAWDFRKVDSEMKYRLLFTWHLLSCRLVDDGNEAANAHRFWSCVSGTDPNEDLWFWEDEDEEYIQTFTNGWDLSVWMSEVEWADACRALEARQLQHSHPRTPSPVSHLTPQTRLGFIAWLIVGNVHLKERAFPWVGLNDLIKYWQQLPIFVDSIFDYSFDFSFGWTVTTVTTILDCHHCGVSFMNVWLETMLQVYSIDDLQSIPWYQQCTCFPE
ncbi:hypothetical protein K438DRAFT_441806 [Mycena galopus ATCC 62051]|nr:hypothetical protein K438DRAFT_441806 [Mycena galopus ATCC 62051]